MHKTVAYPAIAGMLLAACTAPATTDFDAALTCVADGWNAGDAHRASQCFAEDAIYTEGGQKQLYEGRQALFEFFGGEDGRDSDMSMTWHGRAFDPKMHTGYAEFSFEYGTYAHGVAIIKLDDGLIKTWREYWYESEDDWADFIAPRKETLQ